MKQRFETFLFYIDLLRSLISALFFLSIVHISTKNIWQAQATLGDLVFVISASLICKRDIWRLSLQIIDIHKGWGFVQDVKDLLKMTKQTPKPDLGYEAEEPLNSIELKNTSFQSNGSILIEDVSLSIERGEKIAIIGPSGSGKTTLAKLLACLYHPSVGEIKLNQENKDRWGRKLAKNIVYLDQNVNLFNRSLWENIFYHQGDDGIPSEHTVKNILSLSLCDSFISRLPSKLDTNASNLSSGQKHLAAVARAMYEDPDWLILDEPGVFLDPISEERLIRNMQAFAGNKTLIIITHSPKTLQLVDRVLVIEAGKLRVDSKFSTLENSKFYQKFVNYGK